MLISQSKYYRFHTYNNNTHNRMQKQKKLTFKQKIKLLFCARPQVELHQQPSSKHHKNSHNSKNKIIGAYAVSEGGVIPNKINKNVIKKQPRQTFNIDQLFVKVSRKNIVEEEFFTNSVLNLQMQRHIAGRLKGCAIGLVRGDFSEQATNTLKAVIYMTQKPTKTLPYRQQIKTQSMFKIRSESIDMVLYQTTICMKVNSIEMEPKKKFQNLNMKYKNNGNQSMKMGNYYNIESDDKIAEKQYKQICQVLQTYAGKVDNMIIICSKNFESQYLSDPDTLNPQLPKLKKQLAVYCNEYMFELQRIRQNQQIICNIVYISTNATFLRILDKGFKQYIMGQMDLTIQEEHRMDAILTQLFLSGYHRQVLYTLRLIKKESFTTRSLFQPFIMRVSSQNAQIHKIVTSMKDLVFKQQTIDNTPELVQPTPIFNHNSNLKNKSMNYSHSDLENSNKFQFMYQNQ